MKILYESPPNIKQIEAVFTVNSTTVFTYGDTLYNPNRCPIDIPIMAHEMQHSLQQGSDPKAWWDKYLSDPQFRLSQEIIAYGAQYRTMCNYIKNRDDRALNLQRLAETLAGGMYGAIISLADAKKAICKKMK